MMTKTTASIRISPELLKEAKKAAIDADISLSEFIEQALRTKIKGKR